MTDDLDPLRRIRPDRVQSDDPNDPEAISRGRERLMSVIDPSTLEGEVTEPTHWPTLYPRLGYRDEAAALEFLCRAFGFRERREARMGEGSRGDPMLAWLEVGDGVVMIGRAAPEAQGGHNIYTPLDVGRSTCMLNVAVDDVDAHFERARDEGARIAMELNDTFWGDRRYEAYDREGHHWHFHEALSHVRARRGTTDDATD